MAFLVTCECGHPLEAADDLAGKQVPCPKCGKPIQLPEPYNPLSTAKYMQAAEEAVVPAEEAAPPRLSGPPCESCTGSGRCRYCGGKGKLEKPILDRVSAALSGTVSGIAEFLSDTFGSSPSTKKYQTRSEQRRAGSCPSCEGSGKCFGCEGSGHTPVA